MDFTFHLMMAAAQKQLPAVSYIGRTFDSSNASSYTFSGASIGSERSDRLVIVCVSGTRFGTMPTVDSVTIGGNTAQLTDTGGVYNGGTGVSAHTAIAYLNVASGTTADIVVTLSASASNCAINVFTVTGLSSYTPSDVSVDGSGSATSVSVTTQSGGVVIASASNRRSASGITCEWTNVTESYDFHDGGESSGDSGGYASNTSSGSLTVGSSFSETVANGLAVASWR